MLPLTACPKVAEYSNEKPFSQSALRKRIHAPSPPPQAPRWPSSTSTRLLPSKASTATVLSPISSRSLVTLQDLDRLAGEEPASILVEELRARCRPSRTRRKCCRREPLVRREQDDAVQLAPPAMLLQVVLVLEDVGVHQQRLAAAGRASRRRAC